jgi:hypothetical protein
VKTCIHEEVARLTDDTDEWATDRTNEMINISKNVFCVMKRRLHPSWPWREQSVT